MAVYRPVQISFWQKKFILKLTPEAKYFYIYLLTNSKTSQCGVYELPLSVIELETGYNRDTVTKLLEQFIQSSKIKYDYENEEIYVLNWLKYNQINNVNVMKCVLNELSEIKNITYVSDFLLSLDNINKDSSLNKEIRGYIGACKEETETEEKTETKTKEEMNEELTPENIVAIWNLSADNLGLPKIIKLSSKRRASVLRRLKEEEFDISTILAKIKESKFLQGNNDRKWKADFDWIFLSTDNYLKVIEGKYADKIISKPQIDYDNLYGKKK